jgi:hypothetical protein
MRSRAAERGTSATEGAMSHSVVRWAVVAVVLAGAPAHADPIMITGGVLSFHWTSVGIEGPFFGFDLAKPPYNLNGYFGPYMSLPSNSVVACDPCFNGDRVSFSGTFPLRFGHVWVGTEQDPTGEGYFPTGSFSFTSPDTQVFTEPERGRGRAVAPFEFNGWLRVYSDETQTDVIFESFLKGRGTATAKFDDEFPFQTKHYWDSSRYDFAPVPEPATLVLVGGGLMSAGALRRRSRRSLSTR